MDKKIIAVVSFVAVLVAVLGLVLVFNQSSTNGSSERANEFELELISKGRTILHFDNTSDLMKETLHWVNENTNLNITSISIMTISKNDFVLQQFGYEATVSFVLRSGNSFYLPTFVMHEDFDNRGKEVYSYSDPVLYKYTP